MAWEFTERQREVLNLIKGGFPICARTSDARKRWVVMVKGQPRRMNARVMRQLFALGAVSSFYQGGDWDQLTATPDGGAAYRRAKRLEAKAIRKALAEGDCPAEIQQALQDAPLKP